MYFIDSVHVVRNENYLIVSGTWHDDFFGDVHFAGAAKKHPNDDWVLERGLNLALGRAYINLGTQLVDMEMDLLASEEDGLAIEEYDLATYDDGCGELFW
jgi:hypothetical protein